MSNAGLLFCSTNPILFHSGADVLLDVCQSITVVRKDSPRPALKTISFKEQHCTISLTSNGYVFQEMSEWKNQCVDLF